MIIESLTVHLLAQVIINPISLLAWSILHVGRILQFAHFRKIFTRLQFLACLDIPDWVRTFFQFLWFSLGQILCHTIFNDIIWLILIITKIFILLVNCQDYKDWQIVFFLQFSPIFLVSIVLCFLRIIFQIFHPQCFTKQCFSWGHC